MIYVFNKNKILSYLMACSLVLMLFAFYENIIPNKELELIKVYANVNEKQDNIHANNNLITNTKE